MPLIMLAMVGMVGSWLWRIYRKQTGNNPAAAKDVISSICLGLGLVLCMSPLLLGWFIHGSYERYMWIIQGPPPFSMMGGGPFQVAMYFGLVMSGFGLIALGLWMRRSGSGTH